MLTIDTGSDFGAATWAERRIFKNFKHDIFIDYAEIMVFLLPLNFLSVLN